MLFNSVEFLIFFPVVTALYYLLDHHWRWALLLLASCGFYMAFVPVYILILLVTILIDYFAAIWIEESTGEKRRVFLIASIVSTCLVLFAFKYFNFFNTNFAGAAKVLGWNYSIPALEIILPIGLSFHTFQSLSYVIEVYRGHQKAERHFGIYSLYVMFYPQLVAGPIERPQNLLHQFREKHLFRYTEVTNGLKLMAWGLFKKVVIADRLAAYVHLVYSDPSSHKEGITFVVATFLFAYQIYCDFSGYSDIAIGSAQVMGFKLMTNFNRPYHAKSVAEFWKRWHISLSTWFRDYVYLPLGGNRVAMPRLCLNLFVTFLISGLWHGANWTYVIWGALNGLYLILSVWTRGLRSKIVALVGLDRAPFLHKAAQVLLTFNLICFSWVFFRAASLSDALHIVRSLGNVPAFLWHILSNADKLRGGHQLLAPVFLDFGKAQLLACFFWVLFLEAFHLLQRKGGVRVLLAQQPPAVRWSAYVFLTFGILVFGAFNDSAQFIYFQF